jgi:hypothetical protein
VYSRVSNAIEWIQKEACEGWGESGGFCEAESAVAPTKSPTKAPSPNPTKAPTPNPTTAPVPSPTNIPTPNPTTAPVQSPTKTPTPNPTTTPLTSPTTAPTVEPTVETTSTAGPYSSEACREKCQDIENGNPVTVNGSQLKIAIEDYLDDPSSSPYGSVLDCWDMSQVSILDRFV